MCLGRFGFDNFPFVQRMSEEPVIFIMFVSVGGVSRGSRWIRWSSEIGPGSRRSRSMCTRGSRRIRYSRWIRSSWIMGN